MNGTRALKWFKQFNPCARAKSARVAKLRLISLDKALSLSLKRQAVRILDSINH
jgi:hypothetical protein